MSRVPGPGFHVKVPDCGSQAKGPRWRVLGPGSNAWVPGSNSRVPGLLFWYAKNCTQENVKCHIQHEEKWLGWIVIEQVNYYFRLMFLEKNSARTLSKPLQKSNRVYSEKMKAKCVKEDVWKSLQVGNLQLHYILTSSQIIFRDFNYMNAFK